MLDRRQCSSTSTTSYIAVHVKLIVWLLINQESTTNLHCVTALPIVLARNLPPELYGVDFASIFFSTGRHFACFYWKADYMFHFWGHKICILYKSYWFWNAKEKGNARIFHRYTDLCSRTDSLFIFFPPPPPAVGLAIWGRREENTARP